MMKNINDLLLDFTGKLYDLCLEILKQFGETSDVFEYVCKNYKAPPENGTIQIEEYFDEAEIEEYKSIYGGTVNGLLNSTIKKANLGVIPAEDFYRVLWESVCANFSTIKERAFSFYYILIDVAIPFQYLGKPLSMSNERFRTLCEENQDHIAKVKYILKSRYGQRTERASLLLNCLNSIEDMESKVVVLTQAITILSKPSLFATEQTDLDLLIQRIDEKIAELEAQTD